MWEGHKYWIVFPGILFFILISKRALREQLGIILFIIGMLILSVGEIIYYNLCIHSLALRLD